jgi:hypothetical protein
VSRPGGTIPGEPLLERLGLGTSSILELARRLAIVMAIAAVLSAAAFAFVESLATGVERVGQQRVRWSELQLARAPGEIAFELAIVGIAAVIGRKVLRLKL